jgi:quercetin dioxygenase-like cupin family protein
MPLDASKEKSHVVLDVLGPTIEFLVPQRESDAGYCILKGTIPPSVSIPLHSHPDDESFFLISGSVQALEKRKDELEWTIMNPGDFRHVTPGVKHAWKNQSNEPAVVLIVTTPRLGRFFQEVGRPVTADTFPQPPSPDDVQRFVDAAARYDHWLGSPEENAAVGIKLL